MGKNRTNNLNTASGKQTIEFITDLINSDNSLKSLAKKHKLSINTANEIINNFNNLTGSVKSLDELRRLRVRLFESVELELLNSLISPAQLSRATLQQKAYALKIVSDLRKLETGQPTQLHAHAHIDISAYKTDK